MDISSGDMTDVQVRICTSAFCAPTARTAGRGSACQNFSRTLMVVIRPLSPALTVVVGAKYIAHSGQINTR